MITALLLHQNVTQLEENDACLKLVSAQLHSFESTIAACAARRVANAIFPKTVKDGVNGGYHFGAGRVPISDEIARAQAVRR